MSGELRIRDVVERSGVAEATLRAWESRHGFPSPRRLPSGHRRYDERDVQLVREVARLRDAGVPVPAAIERARRSAAVPQRSVFAALRELRPDLGTAVLPKRSLVAMSRAIEDESARGATDLLLFGAFQQERHYRASEARWRELARAAQLAAVFADFAHVRRPRGGPVELPIPERAPLEREWVVVCESAGGAACLVAWEPPGQQEVPDGRRRFETVWTADRASVRHAAQLCLALAGDAGGEIAGPIAARLAEPVADGPGELRRAEALTSRMIAYLAVARVAAA
jgi:DNA-binding transcriptional MerR regulator